MMRPSSSFPFLCSSRQYSHAWRHMLKVPFRCTATTASQSSSAMLKIIRSRRMPALLTTMSSLPKVSSAHWTMRLAALKSATLSPLAIAWPPIFLISATTSCAGVAVGAPVPSKCAPRSFTTTFAPCLARSSASSRPMPRPEPVTIATLPSSNIGEPPLGDVRGHGEPAPAARATPRERAGRVRDAGERARRPRLGPARARLPRALPRRALVRRTLRGRAGRDAGRLRARRAARAVARALEDRRRLLLPRRLHAPLALLARVDAGPLRLPALRVGRGPAGRADGARLPRPRRLQHAERHVLHDAVVASPARAPAAPRPRRHRRAHGRHRLLPVDLLRAPARGDADVLCRGAGHRPAGLPEPRLRRGPRACGHDDQRGPAAGRAAVPGGDCLWLHPHACPRARGGRAHRDGGRAAAPVLPGGVANSGPGRGRW